MFKKNNLIRPEDYFTKEELKDFSLAPIEKLETFVNSDGWWNFFQEGDAIEVLIALEEKKVSKKSNKESSLVNKTKRISEIF